MAHKFLIGALVLFASTTAGGWPEKEGEKSDEHPLMQPAHVLAEHDDGSVDLRVMVDSRTHGAIGGADFEVLNVKPASDPAWPDRGTFVLREEYVPAPKKAKKAKKVETHGKSATA